MANSIDLLLEGDIHVGYEGCIAHSEVYGIPHYGTPVTFESAQLIAPESWRPMIRNP
jgi:hypothetical protein